MRCVVFCRCPHIISYLILWGINLLIPKHYMEDENNQENKNDFDEESGDRKKNSLRAKLLCSY